MRGLSERIPKSHIALAAALPLILNIFLTPFILVYVVSLEEYLKRPFYYLYYWGPFIWSIYHVLLLLLVWKLLRRENDSLKEIIGPMLDDIRMFVVIVAGLLSLSIILFQFIESFTMDLIYGFGTTQQMLSEFRSVPQVIALYGIIITPLTAGICEEIVWRGYLQTRLELKLGGRAGIAAAIQAILFGFWHFVSVHAVFTMVFSFISGLIYARVRRLTPLMVSHWLGDVIGFSTMYFRLL